MKKMSYTRDTMRLSLIASPIGNLEDITIRALSTLKNADAILCEDTRNTLKLLRRYGIEKPLFSYHQRSSPKITDRIIHMLQEGSHLALITDAGTPGISDPGNELIASLLAHCGSSIEIVPIPGVSAVCTICSVAGIPMQSFLFVGFPPHKKKRGVFFSRIVDCQDPVVFFESPHRILKSLRDIASLLPGAYVIVGRELTKIHETIYRGMISDVMSRLEKEGPRGEFTVIVAKQTPECAAHPHCRTLPS